MKDYEPGDMATFYFITFEDKYGNKRIQAWTDDKAYAEYYMEFHHCKQMTLKKVTNTIEEIIKILNENNHDEIRLQWISVRSKKDSIKDDVEWVCIPATRTEFDFVTSETDSFMISRVNYSYLASAIPYLKPKYRKALNSIFLGDIINKVVYNKQTKIAHELHFDQLAVLYRSFPSMFGDS